MKLQIYHLTDDSKPWTGLRPAAATRRWLPGYAYRCLPLAIANRLGIEITLNREVKLKWDGSDRYDCIKSVPQWIDCGSHFGSGIVSFSIPYLFRTPRGWSLWVGGPANEPMDGIAPLEGIVETGWTPYTFTMNWRMTMVDQWVTFVAGQAIARVVPIRIAPIQKLQFKLEAKSDLPKRKLAEYERWWATRNDFLDKLRKHDPEAVNKAWQKDYVRGARHKKLCPAGLSQTEVMA